MAVCTGSGCRACGIADMYIAKRMFAIITTSRYTDFGGMRMRTGGRGAPTMVVGGQLFRRKGDACPTASGTVCVAPTRGDDCPIFELDPCSSGKNRGRADGAGTFPDKTNGRGIVSRSQTFYDSDRHQLTLLQTYLPTYGFKMLNACPLPVFPIVTEWVCAPALLVVFVSIDAQPVVDPV